MEIKQQINEWISQENSFHKSDLLVHLQIPKCLPHKEIYTSKEFAKIYSKTQISIKENGINPLCRTRGTLTWTFKNEIIETPIWLIPVQVHYRKINQSYHIEEFEATEGFLNPFIEKRFKEDYDIELNVTSYDELLSKINERKIGEINSTNSFVGNFHHHRYEIIRELELLLETNHYSMPFKQLLGGEKEVEYLQLSEQLLLERDRSHQEAFDLFQRENIVVQGPPGTGKSQLLTNLIGKLLNSNASITVVSQKRAALEVIQKRLQKKNLADLAIVVTDELQPKDFIADLKKTWINLESYQPQPINKVHVRKQLENQLQQNLDILNHPTLMNGSSYYRFEQLFPFEHENQLTRINIPTIPEYEDNLELVETIYRENLQQFFQIIRQETIHHYTIKELEVKLEDWKHEILPLHNQNILQKVEDISTWQYKSATFQLFENELAKKHLPILQPDSREQKQFVKLFTKHKKITLEYQQLFSIKNSWKIIPSDVELKSLKVALKSGHYFQKRKAKKRWSELTAIDVSMHLNAIEELRKVIKRERELDAIMLQLMSLGVDDIKEAEMLHSTLHLFNTERWNNYKNLTNIELQILREQPKNWSDLNQRTRQLFHVNANLTISEIIAKIDRLPYLQSHYKAISLLPKVIYQLISQVSTFEQYTQTVRQSSLLLFQSQFPPSLVTSNKVLLEKVRELKRIVELESFDTSERIISNSHQQFTTFHKILNTSSAKLSEQDKLLKQTLKRGKSILIKEFGKSRQHWSIRQLISSEARLWIQALKPIWLTNPSQLANTLPLEPNLFDVCIIDEASQMPVQHALGSLQRSKRIIIAGDEQQMQPTSYFKAQSVETTSLLHHASFYFPKVFLKQHYRSKHQSLINFSNKHFYENKLVAFPSYPINKNALTLHHIKDGVLRERTNHEEAEYVGQLLLKNKQQLITKSIGIVAFSKEQVDCITKAIPKELNDIIQKKMANNTFFIKPLEKVQGDECEHLIISLGYATNEQGRFVKQFGPLNKAGGKNRLNVLFSRASEHIDFVCSITSNDLAWSENESVQLLHQWFQFIEKQQYHSSIEKWPFNLTITADKEILRVKHIYHQLPHVLDLYTFVNCLEARGWTIEGY